MKIHLKELKNGLNHLNFREAPEDLELKLPEGKFYSKVAMKLTIHKMGYSLRCQGDIKTSFMLECSRCLVEYRQPIEAEIGFILELDDERAGIDTSDDDYQFLTRETIFYDLNQRVREAVLLAFPLKPLCQEDCKGLCQFCGTNLNERECNCTKEKQDPRWEKLRELFPTG